MDNHTSSADPYEDLSEYLHFYHTNQKNYLAVQYENSEYCFETGMILNNSLPYLLPVSFREQKDHFELYYDISNMQSLEAIHRGRQYHFPELSDYLKCLKTLLDELDDHLLNADDLVLREEYLFVSYEGNRLGFLYLPGYGVSFRDQMKDLNEQIMKRLDHYDERATRLIYELDRLFCLENWNFEGLFRVLESSKGEEKNKETERRQPKGSEDILRMETAGKERPKSEGVSEKKQRNWWQKLTGLKNSDLKEPSSVVREPSEGYDSNRGREDLPSSEGENEDLTPLAEEENTGLLQEEEFPTPILLPLEEHRQRIPIRQEQVVIGSLKERTDFYLEDPHISRMHLRIFREEGIWYIMDQNSTNGTFLEEERLLPYEKYELRDRSRVRIADREYVFRL